MDGTTTSAFTSGGEAATVRVILEGRQLVEAINVHGPAHGSLTVRAVVDDRAVDIPGLQRIDLSPLAAGWGRFAAIHPFEADGLMLDWTPSDAFATLPEVEVWGTGEPRSTEVAQPLADRILLRQARADVDVQATPDVLVVSAPAFVREPLAGVLTFQLDADPRTLTRAFLVYELSGLQHWTAASRSINRVALRASYRPASGAAGGTQVEEIAPAWLRRGLNQVLFRPVDPNDPVGYRVQHLRVVGFRGLVADGASGAVDGARQALTDGDPTTGTMGQGRGVDPTWSLGPSAAVHEVDVLVTRPWNGTLDLLATAAGRSERRRLHSGPLPMGWQRLSLDPPLSAEQTTLSVRSPGEA